MTSVPSFLIVASFTHGKPIQQTVLVIGLLSPNPLLCSPSLIDFLPFLDLLITYLLHDFTFCKANATRLSVTSGSSTAEHFWTPDPPASPTDVFSGMCLTGSSFCQSETAERSAPGPNLNGRIFVDNPSISPKSDHEEDSLIHLPHHKRIGALQLRPRIGLINPPSGSRTMTSSDHSSTNRTSWGHQSSSPSCDNVFHSSCTSSTLDAPLPQNILGPCTSIITSTTNKFDIGRPIDVPLVSDEAAVTLSNCITDETAIDLGCAGVPGSISIIHVSETAYRPINLRREGPGSINPSQQESLTEVD
ncbi:unnamed protein product [Protopolystoma xenopodis]|uniref:Uncharacterized protein n=1 Tax=Protopolystoma xenopodis TaxID=117903 RepID=A0A3S5BMU3_9PLAT|nr:unnamed protein product [Protopolystoma xenopodis]